MNYFCQILFCLILLHTIEVQGQLVVTVSHLKIVGQKAVVKLELKNTFTNAVESARAAVFVSDEKGKVVGQATRWIIGGAADRPALEPDKETTFHFVIPLGEELSTNLQVRILPNRLNLKDGQPTNPVKDVQIVQ